MKVELEIKRGEKELNFERTLEEGDGIATLRKANMLESTNKPKSLTLLKKYLSIINSSLRQTVRIKKLIDTIQNRIEYLQKIVNLAKF